VAGGALRIRHVLTNTGPDPYFLDGLEVVVPVPDHLVEVLDFTGRHERERTPQRHQVTDGLWLREGRAGRPGLGAATMVVLGSPGFSTTYGEVLGVHVGWSGNTVLRVERDPATGTTLGGGELLLPGEATLAPGESYASPWVYVAAADDGLDGLAAVWHAHQRSLATHPPLQPVVLNVWEAVYFDHDLGRLKAIADSAARIGVERFVLDDGWFHQRRDDTVGLGDWTVDPTVWPEGLTPLVDHVRGLGMQFGLWIEPEMVNPDSDLYREHPDWILSAGERVPLLHRNQLVLDLGRDEVRAHVFRPDHGGPGGVPDRLGEVGPQPRPAGGRQQRARGCRRGAPQTEGFYALLDDLRAAHPTIDWESCASGGGRVDLGVLERVQRIWTSDMTDAVARQQIQRWTTQLVAPEYVGAHVSSPVSHTTGRTLGLDFRAATALFGSFGIEWDLTEAGRRRPRPAGRVGGALPALPSPVAQRPGGASRVHRPVRTAARRGRGRPVRGAARARAARRVGPQPRSLRTGARPRRRGVVRAGLGGSGRPRLDQHVVAAAAGRTDGRHAGDRTGARQPGFLGAPPSPGDGHAGAPDPELRGSRQARPPER
jgi:alpha-galactosidase